MTTLIDTHIHLDGDEYAADRSEVMARAAEAGVSKMLIPAIDEASSQHILSLCAQHPGTLYPMIGLHPEEVRPDWEDALRGIHNLITPNVIAIGEVGLDFYWSREFESEQIQAFEEQVHWAIEKRLPLMIHCRKAQNEMIHILRRYADDLVGGVFHCFTGNLQEAEQLLAFPGFALGIGGVLTFKKSHLPEVLPHIPLNRIVLETDAPYMAPVPMRGKRNESAYITHIAERAAQALNITTLELAEATTANAQRIFHI
ncbi:MAG: TatD family hydrolase [Bacteroidaceae bacterium]|nr:TatD family hydrolase [Bacteroidaceae bacterium]